MDEDAVAQINSLKETLNNKMTEIKEITNQARLAKDDEGQFFLFKGMYVDLKLIYGEFKHTYELLLDAYKNAGSNPTDTETKNAAAIRRSYFECNAVYEKYMNPTPISAPTVRAPTIPITPSTSATDGNTFLQGSRMFTRRNHLPEIKLPKFDGQMSEWISFRDTYLSLIHTSDILSDMEKYHYLISAVTGPAKANLKSVPFTEENYEQAWKALTDNYNNNRLLASNFLKALLDFKPLTGKPSFNSLKSFLTNISENVNAFKLLKVPQPEEFILFSLAIRCLDPTTRMEFEKEYDNVEYPTVTNLTDFVKRECRSYELTVDHSSSETLSNSKNSENRIQKDKQTKSAFFAQKTEDSCSRNGSKTSFNRSKSSSTDKNQRRCIICQQAHSLYGCSKFREAKPQERISMLKSFKGCRNCLSYDHVVQKCSSKRDCGICHRLHHSWLHLEQDNDQQSSSSQHNTISSKTSDFCGTSGGGEVLLGTAIAHIRDSRGYFQPVRMVLDSGSQHSFVTNKCVQKLGFKPKPCSKTVSGIGQTLLHGLKGTISCIIRPLNHRSVQLSTDAIAVSSITNELPHSTIHSDFVNRCDSYHLADPNFWKPGPVEFLLGADLYYDVVNGAPLTIEDGQPKLTPTIFGHVVAGRAHGSNNSVSTSLFVESDLPTIINKFWEVESVQERPLTSEEGRKCERHFANTHYRLPTGRYVVSLPLKTPDLDLSESRQQALTRFINLENKLRKQSALKVEYISFMTDYLELGHMKVASRPGKYFIPHHPVVKMNGDKFKIRVVFDASCVTKKGSLNDHLMVGDKLQLDIADIILNFRLYEVVFVTDIIKMFRQTMVAPDDCSYQHIFWRFNDIDEIQEYELSTITYGLASSPYLALRVIRQLVDDEGSEYPLASKALTDQIYVDDILTGSHTLEGALALQRKLVELLGKGCFQLSKWLSNRKELLSSPCVTQDMPYDLDSEFDNSVKILGLQYCPKQDAFMYHIDTPPKTLTKRAILSAISKIYDPLGYIAPVVFEAKTILQEAWRAKCDWDQRIPPNLAESWESFVDELHTLSGVRVPRLLPVSVADNIQVLGFCDASTKGYAAAVYMRLQINRDVQSFLIKAKTKLAPTKPTTIPRLELNGALLVAKIVTSIQLFLKKLSVKEFHWFTDSTIVLGWLKTDPTLLKAYVAHRVVTINEAIQFSDWRHIRTEDNPVDCASRGLRPSELASHDLWWSGPQWLKSNPDEWPTLAGTSSIEVPQDDPEMKKLSPSLLTRDAPFFMKMIERFSSYYRLLRSCAILHRFMTWLTTKQENKKPISVYELQQCQTLIIIFIQSYHFSSDKSLEKLKTSRTGRLDPFLDPHGVVRVGGRLKNSQLSYQQKHPILLPGNCHFTRLLIDHYHEAYLHLSPSLLQNLIQNQFWILSARNTIKQRVHRCLKCFKSNPKPQPPLMGNLPASRFADTKPFTNVGVDYGGPFLIKASLRRNAAVSKAYLSLFVCMSTKALHLELVSSGTTEAFMAALDRFIARRGKPAHIYSHNGRNFVGASRELKETVAWLNDEQGPRRVHQHLAIQAVDWSFNPPLTPHFGGLWEAGIKSAKAILKKAISPTPFTFEELSTIFARTEAILNSRPLCPLYSDPASVDVLTPGHFLIGGPLIAAPELHLLDCRENALSRWQLVKQRVQYCWKRWRNEYLSTLQQRVKWLKPTRSVTVGDLVLLRDVNTPVSQWPTARVLEAHPGNDGIVRVITVKTASSTYKRSVANVVPLDPILKSSSEPSPAPLDGCSCSLADSSAPEV